MSLRFDGQTTYILPLTNKHGLSRFKPEKLLTEDSFSFCCTMQVEWDNIDSEKAGGVLLLMGCTQVSWAGTQGKTFILYRPTFG